MQYLKHIAGVLTTSFAETLWPTRCIGCDAPGTLLCPACTRSLPYIDPATACPRCGAPHGFLTCTECTQAHPERALEEAAGPVEEPPTCTLPFEAARARLLYEGTARRLITAYKDGGELRLDSVLATLLLQAIRDMAAPGGNARGNGASDDWVQWADMLVSVPARTQALRTRGFDHMRRIASLVGTWTGLGLEDVLGHAHATADQRALSARARSENLQGSFALTHSHALRGARVLLVDDVLTTGATTSAATRALLAGGAREVRVAVIARVVK